MTPKGWNEAPLSRGLADFTSFALLLCISPTFRWSTCHYTILLTSCTRANGRLKSTKYLFLRASGETTFNDKDYAQTIYQLTQVASTEKMSFTGEIKSLAKSNTQMTACIGNLEQEVADKNHQIGSLENQVQELQGDLQHMVAWQQDSLSGQINRTEESMQGMVEQFVGMVDMLSGHGKRMNSILKSRNIPMPNSTNGKGKQSPDLPSRRGKHSPSSPSRQGTQHRRSKSNNTTTANSSVEEKKADDEPPVQEDDDAMMMNHIAAAATTALQE
jgi:TolA-binding protein